MSDRTSLSTSSILSMSTECSDSDVISIALSEDFQTESLESHVKRFETVKNSISWTRLMEWFIEAVIGIYHSRKQRPSAPPLTNENIRIDASSTILIETLSSQEHPSNQGSLSSDIATLCKFFLDIHGTLEHHKLLILPLDPDKKDLVFARIMVALVEHFVASGDLILQNASPNAHENYFADCCRKLRLMDDPYSKPFLPNNLASTFAQLVLRPYYHHSFIVADNSFLRGHAVENSKQFLDIVKKVNETNSLEIVQNSYFNWKEWVTMMERIEKDTTLVNDLSFLQSRCFRKTLKSLQSKHQLIANKSQIDENYHPESCPFSTTIDPSIISSVIRKFADISFNLPSSFEHHTSSTGSSLHSTISTLTSLPPSQSFSDESLTSEQNTLHSGSIVDHSKLILTEIHDIFARPCPTSFPWDLRPSDISESVVDVSFQPHPLFVNVNEKFNISLLDDTDDLNLLTSLRRCRGVIDSTRSTKCIPDVHNFRTRLISGLHSSNPELQFECYHLFCEIGDCLHIVDDPHHSCFSTLRTAFRDGTYWEKRALLRLWIRWVNFRAQNGDRQYLKVFDFDFVGFQTTDLSEVKLFNQACEFFGTIFLNDAMLMPFPWQLDFLHQFEKTNRMLSRIANDPRLNSGQIQPDLYITPLAVMLGSVLSVFRGCDFPSALTEVITSDLAICPQKLPKIVNPTSFLNHTSITRKHRNSFFPMDLMFERYLRSDPDAFLAFWPDVSECTSRKFLNTPYIGLHSLLLRCPKLNLDHQALRNLVAMLFIERSRQETTRADIHNIFSLYPPPRLIDTLLSSPHIGRTPTRSWIDFLNAFSNFGEYTTVFGACSSLAKVFNMLTPFEWNDDRLELNLLRQVGEKVVSLHWLNVPAHFDSPLLCHLPSLAGAQRGVLQTLSSHSGIPSLVLPHTLQPNWNSIVALVSKDHSVSVGINVLSLCVRYFQISDLLFSPIERFLVEVITANLLCRFPALVSTAFEFFLRFVSVASDGVRMELVMKAIKTGGCLGYSEAGEKSILEAFSHFIGSDALHSKKIATLGRNHSPISEQWDEN
ncbi:hypothetical protein BLNAU_23939 [Blattamonas nauphoetae]|uniref:Uncharacterized protein n=1 Tax=Blattamonas nauphoetae TaxID=2049346 RepID=A0ABQ9WNU3_9EUKA|nr:hypothetical protein BLNAU_23939 [Blattamonas nauphoetae]